MILTFVTVCHRTFLMIFAALHPSPAAPGSSCPPSLRHWLSSLVLVEHSVVSVCESVCVDWTTTFPTTDVMSVSPGGPVDRTATKRMLLKTSLRRLSSLGSQHNAGHSLGLSVDICRPRPSCNRLHVAATYCWTGHWTSGQTDGRTDTRTLHRRLYGLRQ